MTEPVSYRLLEAVQDRLQLILVANGYRTDIGARVFIDAAYEPTDTQPSVFVLASDFARRAEGSTARVRSSDVTLDIQAVIPSARATAVLDAHRARADILKALFDTSSWMPRDADGSAATNLTITTDQIQTRPGGSPAIVVQITASAGLTERITPTQ